MANKYFCESHALCSSENRKGISQIYRRFCLINNVLAKSILVETSYSKNCLFSFNKRYAHGK